MQFSSYGQQLFILILCVAGAVVVTANQCLLYSTECICCGEVDRVAVKIQESELKLPRITDHEGFAAVCLNVWVLQTAYYQYRQHYGSSAPKPIHQ